MNIRLRLCTLSAAIALLPLTAMGQTLTPLGTITADFDGRRLIQETVMGTTEGEASATATVSTLFGMVMVTLYTASRDQFSIDMTFSGGQPGQTPPAEATISYFTDGIGGQIWQTTPETGAPVITITRYETDGAMGHVTGSFEASLCWQEDMFGEPDPSRCQPVSGTFDTGLIVED